MAEARHAVGLEALDMRRPRRGSIFVDGECMAQRNAGIYFGLPLGALLNIIRNLSNFDSDAASCSFSATRSG